MPKIKLEYYKRGKKINKSVAINNSSCINENSQKDELIRTEIYEYVNGEYNVIHSESIIKE